MIEKENFLFNNLKDIKGIGNKISSKFLKKRIIKIYELLLALPYSSTDRSNLKKLNNIEIGKICTITIRVDKYNFPRIRNLPFTIKCSDEFGKIDLVFFNSREGYIRKKLPLRKWVVVSGKINYFNKNYQIVNPEYIEDIKDLGKVNKEIPKYSLPDGLSEKIYIKIIEKILTNLPKVKEWHNKEILSKLGLPGWYESICFLHKKYKQDNINSKFYRRLVFDEIVSNLIVLSKNRKIIKKIKKKPKLFTLVNQKKIIKNINFRLTEGQNNIIYEINNDLKNDKKMFRILQGDVGSGKTIIALIAASNVIEDNFQCAFMAPTEILAKQHYDFAKNILANLNIKIALLTSKVDNKEKRQIFNDVEKGKIDFVIGTHSIFQKKVNFKNLGFIIIDEQHKFGVNQRMSLSQKGGDNCDVLLMSATPIPRTMMLSVYGDMDISRLTEKPFGRKEILTFSKPENKIEEIYDLIKKEISKNQQVFWICPLIKKSNILEDTSVNDRYKKLNLIFPKKVGLLHGEIPVDEKNSVLNKFLNKELSILVSTTVIEVGINFPNANLIIIDSANKFGLAQLHQLRGRVGRGDKQGKCILLFKKSLSKNAIKRIKILKKSNDGFFIAEEDMNLRGFGDMMGYQQSGLKYYRYADPVLHKDIFDIANSYIKEIEEKEINLENFHFLLKLFDKAEITNIE